MPKCPPGEWSEGGAEPSAGRIADFSNRKLAAAGEDWGAADQTRALLLVALGGESSDAAAVCQYAGADRWTTASVRIAEAAAPKKTIPLSSRNGELSEKAGAGCRCGRLSGPVKGGWQPVGPSGRKPRARRARLEANGCTLTTGRRPKN
jgi:hypothetical protein